MVTIDRALMDKSPQNLSECMLNRSYLVRIGLEIFEFLRYEHQLAAV